MIRPAKPTDAPAIARLIILAMGKLAAKFANSDDEQKQLPYLSVLWAKTATSTATAIFWFGMRQAKFPG
jgi:hypothetical protein